MNIACPKCGFEEAENARECARCGIIFGKYGAPPPRRLDIRLRTGSTSADVVPDGRVGAQELKILGIGLVLAIFVYAVPFTRMMFSALVTLFHEFGHAVMGWIFGYPSIPAFDFVYGGGMTSHGTFRMPLALAIAGGLGYLAWLFRQNRKTVAVIGGIFLLWLFFVSAEWRREIAFAAAGHIAEFILAGILFYQALAGVGWRIPEIERPLGAFIAFFVQIHSMSFAWRLMHDPDFLEWYRQGKGGALMNDLEVIALDLHIHTPFNPGIIGATRLLFLFSFVPIAVAMVWYFQRERWHRVLRAFGTADA